MDYFEDLGWSGGVVRKQNKKSNKWQQDTRAVPVFFSEFDDSSCASPCAFACLRFSKTVPSVIWHNSCENLARTLGR